MFTCLSRDGGFHRFLTFLHPMAQTAAHHSRSHDPAGVRPAVGDFGAQAKALRQAQSLRASEGAPAGADALSWRLRCFLSKRPEAVTSLTRIFLGWTRLDSAGLYWSRATPARGRRPTGGANS